MKQTSVYLINEETSELEIPGEGTVIKLENTKFLMYHKEKANPVQYTLIYSNTQEIDFQLTYTQIFHLLHTCPLSLCYHSSFINQFPGVLMFAQY